MQSKKINARVSELKQQHEGKKQLVQEKDKKLEDLKKHYEEVTGEVQQLKTDLPRQVSNYGSQRMSINSQGEKMSLPSVPSNYRDYQVNSLFESRKCSRDVGKISFKFLLLLFF